MSIEKRNDGYTVRWRDAGGRQRSQQVRLWRDAVSLDGDIKRKKAMGELITHERGKITLKEFYELWKKQHAAVHLTPRSTAGYETVWRTYLERRLGQKRLSNVSSEEVSMLCSRLSVGPATVRKILAVLQSILQRAVEWQYIPTNPVASVRKPKLAGNQRRGRVLGQSEFKRLVQANQSERYQAILSVLYETGMRPGELRGLQWTDLSPGAVTIERSISQDQVAPTKTGARRTVELTERLKVELYSWHQVRPSGSFIFPGAAGGWWTDQGYRMWVKQVFRPAAKLAALEGLRPYDLRHTYISRKIREGHDVVWIAARAGNSPDVLLKTYAHEFEAQSVRQECAETLTVAQILSPPPDSNREPLHYKRRD